MRTSIIGFLIGAAVPEVAGFYWLVLNRAHYASHPLGPSEAYCGMPNLGAMAMILIVGPICGGIGASLAFLGSMLFANQRDQLR